MSKETKTTPDTEASPENETLGQEGGLAVVKSYADDAPATPTEGGTQPETAAAMTGHQVWTSIHSNSKLAIFSGAPEAAASSERDGNVQPAPAGSQPDDDGPDVYVHTSSIG